MKPSDPRDPLEIRKEKIEEAMAEEQNKILAEEFIHGKNMVEEYSLSLEAIKATKRTCWGANTEMQVFAIGVEHGIEIGMLKCFETLKHGDWTGLADMLEVQLKNRTKVNY